LSGLFLLVTLASILNYGYCSITFTYHRLPNKTRARRLKVKFLQARYYKHKNHIRRQGISAKKTVKKVAYTLGLAKAAWKKSKPTGYRRYFSGKLATHA